VDGYAVDPDPRQTNRARPSGTGRRRVHDERTRALSPLGGNGNIRRAGHA
jgi:hypothetical protein